MVNVMRYSVNIAAKESASAFVKSGIDVAHTESERQRLVAPQVTLRGIHYSVVRKQHSRQFRFHR
jgi:hypothetical protein